MSETRVVRYEVREEDVGQRLDSLCARIEPASSRSRLTQLIRDHVVRLDGRPAKPSEKVRAGQIVEMTIPALEEHTVQAEEIPLSIVHEDAHVLVLDKPAGLVVHPGSGVRDGTLVSALLNHDPSLAGVGGQARAGLVHRLDRGTSGVLLVAKSDVAHRRLSEQFRERSVFKLYHALVWGRPRPESGTIDLPIGRDAQVRVRMSTRSRFARPATTEYEVAEEVPGFALVHARLVTGRTHQIRVHLQSLGHPLIGDGTYGGDRAKSVTDPNKRKAIRAFERPALHASEIRFSHPESEQAMSFRAPWPDDLVELWEQLGGRS